jgi:hypothetical protein
MVENTIRTIIGEDCYVPHDHDELRVLLPPRVLERLDRRRKYGVLWYNRRKTSTRQVAVTGTDGKEYRRRTKVTLRPREEWIGVPVPDAGIPKRVVEAARTALLENTAAKNSSGRFWELSGGKRAARCAVGAW